MANTHVENSPENKMPSIKSLSEPFNVQLYMPHAKIVFTIRFGHPLSI